MTKSKLATSHLSNIRTYPKVHNREKSITYKSFQPNKFLSLSLKCLRSLCRLSPTLATKVSTFLFLRPRRKMLNYILLPEGSKKIEVVHNLKKLVGYEWGTDDKTILLVHGWESHLGHMAPLIQPLVNAGYRVIAFDGPGHGQSPQLLTNMVDFGNAVLSAAEQYAPIHGIIANSFGAAATALMLGREQHVKIDKLVLLSPMNHILQHIRIFQSILAYPDDFQERIINDIAKALPISIDKCDVRQAVQNIHVPGLIIHDLDDQIISPKSSLDIASNYKGSVLKHTEGLGHRGVLRNTNVQQWICNFLMSTS